MRSLPVFDEHLPRAAEQEAGLPVHGTVTLAFELRQRARLRVRLDSGEEAGIQLPRGTILRGGDGLRAADGRILHVRAADEPVSKAACPDPVVLAKAAYHLGNRHVSLEVGNGWLRYLRDHVLDEMVASLGLELRHESSPFEPEAGAYARHGHAHPHPHPHPHSHPHPHAHSHAGDHGDTHGHGDAHGHGPAHGHGHASVSGSDGRRAR